LPADVRNLPELRPSRGDATFNPADKVLEWSIPTKEITSGTGYFGLRCTVLGQLSEDNPEKGGNAVIDYGYDEPYQSAPAQKATETTVGQDDERDAKRAAQNKILMPSSASVSFSVKGWIPSGLKVEAITIDPRKSKGLGENTKPYKGVKYLTVSSGGIEIRC
jgi:hypothetical protein